MQNYVLSCCSTADLSHEHFTSRGIHYICFHYYMDGVEYADDLGKSMSFDDFYAAMQNGTDTKTSQVSAGEYAEYFELRPLGHPYVCPRRSGYPGREIP